METVKIPGQLEIDSHRGVIYFHAETGITVLRICNLPTPIPVSENEEPLDITHMIGASWRGKKRLNFTRKKKEKENED